MPRLPLANLSRERQVIATAWSAVAVLGTLRLVFGLPIPIFDLQVPEYGLGIGAVLIGVGLIAPDVRGLVVMVVGALIVAFSGIDLVAVTTRRWDAMVYGLPLGLLGATGLAVFAHATLHGRPALARRGMTLVVAGFAAAIVLFGAVVLRAYVRGPEATTLIAIVTVVAVMVALATLVIARPTSGPTR